MNGTPAVLNDVFSCVLQSFQQIPGYYIIEAKTGSYLKGQISLRLSD
jgi:hypothetical protein